MYLYQLARFLTRAAFHREAEPTPEAPRWHFDREHRVWVESELERHAA